MVPSQPFESVSLDFIVSLPPSKDRHSEYDSILVLVDRYTKSSRYIPARESITAPEPADIFGLLGFRALGLMALGL